MVSGAIALDMRFMPGNTSSFRDRYFSKLMPLLEKARENIIERFVNLYSVSKEGATKFTNTVFFNSLTSMNLFPKKDNDKNKTNAKNNETTSNSTDNHNFARSSGIISRMLLNNRPLFETLVFEKESDFARFVGTMQGFVPGNLGIGLSFTNYSGSTDFSENISAINVMKIKLRISEKLGSDKDAINACFFMTVYHENIHQYGAFRDIKYRQSDGRLTNQNLGWLNDGFVEFMALRVFRQIHGNKHDAALERIDNAGLGSYANDVKIIDALQGVLGIDYIARQFSSAPSKYETGVFLAQNSLAIKQKMNTILESSGDYIFHLGSEIVRNKSEPKNANALTSELISYLHLLKSYKNGEVFLYPSNEKGQLLKNINALAKNPHLNSGDASTLAANVFSYFDLLRYGKTGVTSPPSVVCINSTDGETYRDFARKYTFEIPVSLNRYRQVVSIPDNPILIDSDKNKITVLGINPLPKSNIMFADTHKKLVLLTAAEMYLKKTGQSHSDAELESSAKDALVLGLLHRAGMALTSNELLVIKQFQSYESLFGGYAELLQKYFSGDLRMKNMIPGGQGMQKLPAKMPLYFEELNTYFGILGKYGPNMQIAKSDINVKNYAFKEFESDFNKDNYVGTLKLLSYAVPSLPPFYRMALCSNLLTFLKIRDSLKAPNVAQACLSLSSAHGTHSSLACQIHSLFFLGEPQNSLAWASYMEVHRRLQLNIIKYDTSSPNIFEGIDTERNVQAALSKLPKRAQEGYINTALLDISSAVGNRAPGAHAPSISDSLPLAEFESDNAELRYLMEYYWNKQKYSRGKFGEEEYSRMSGTLDRTLYEFAFACGFVPHTRENGTFVLKNIQPGGIVTDRHFAAPDLSSAFLASTAPAKLEDIRKSFIESVSSKSISFQPADVLFGRGNFNLGMVSGIINSMKDSKAAKTDFLKYANMTTECCLGTNHFATYL